MATKKKTARISRSSKKKTPVSINVARKAAGRRKHSSPQASYDAVDGSNSAGGGGNKRRQSHIETKDETGASGILKPRDRLSLLNLCRDIERNYSQAKSILHQIAMNVIGPSPKMQLNTDDPFGEEVTEWINSDWMKNCDFRGERRFAKLAQLTCKQKKREGDLLVMFDDDMILDSGKIIFFEADQICDVTGSLADQYKAAGWTQQDGIILDQWGREVGYVTTTKRGQTSVDGKDATVFSRDPDNPSENMVKLIREEYRINQGRGVSALSASVSDYVDCYEMRSKELQSAKVAAGQFATVKRKEAIENFDDPRMDPDNENPSDQDPDYDYTDAATTLPEEQDKPANYERLEKLTGGYTEYLDADDEVEYHDFNRPNVSMKDFITFVVDSGGSAMGIAHAYSQLKADTSYTAFRGDMVMTWAGAFYPEQKDMEHDFLDWSTIRAIRWKIKHKGFKNKPTENWERKISWILPKMPFIKELEERKANAQALKNGETTFSELLGPNWLKKFDQLEKELQAIVKKGLPLEILETKSGGQTTEGSEVKETDPDDKGE